MNRRTLLKAGAVLASASAIPITLKAQTLSNKTLVIVSHPYPERSTFIKDLQQAAQSVQGITVRNLESLYGFDTRAKAEPQQWRFC